MNELAYISGYESLELIHTSFQTLVYRGIRVKERRSVVLKVMRNPFPHFDELLRFRNQYTITHHLVSPYIVQPLDLERHDKRYVLVMPDEGALALSDYWQQSERSLGEFLKMGMQLAEALHYLSQQHIIHKDIKPSNILIHPETRHLQLIDFSIASLLPKEQQQLSNTNYLEGTLAYISPEQTGRMNRGIDYRTDFYSLGVTLFELLTGQLPFTSEESMELVHCHIAKLPVPAHQVGRVGERRARGNSASLSSNIPEILSAIILKLMAKNAEDRYQSALGLKYDLEKCWSQWQNKRAIQNFELGQRDVCDRFNLPEKLYGRETEVQTLLDAFERVTKGSTGMMLLAGFSGIGKTAVVNEVYKPITRQRGYFIRGKFEQLNRNIPFSAFVQAFRSLMVQLLSASEVELSKWKAKILEAVGKNGQVIIEVIPELADIIGQQPPVAQLSGSAAQNRFNLLFGKFVQVFTTK